MHINSERWTTLIVKTPPKSWHIQRDYSKQELSCCTDGTRLFSQFQSRDKDGRHTIKSDSQNCESNSGVRCIRYVPKPIKATEYDSKVIQISQQWPHTSHYTNGSASGSTVQHARITLNRYVKQKIHLQTGHTRRLQNHKDILYTCHSSHPHACHCLPWTLRLSTAVQHQHWTPTNNIIQATAASHGVFFWLLKQCSSSSANDWPQFGIL